MGGRKISKMPFTYLHEEEKDLSDVEFGEEIKLGTNILVLAHQPGIGKTYTVKEYMKKNPNTFYFNRYHENISEIVKDFDNHYVQWWGFDETCHYSTFKNRVKKKVPIDIVCWLCEKKRSKCNYWRQFNESPPVFAVFEHLPTRFKGYLKKAEKSGEEIPKAIFLDECKLYVDTYTYKPKEVCKWFKNIGLPDLADKSLHPKFDYRAILEEEDKIKKEFKKAILNTLEQKNRSKLNEILSYSPYNIVRYLGEASKYNDFGRESYTTPLLYHAFELINKDIMLVYIDASFDLSWFAYMLHSFDEERGFKGKELSLKVYYSNWRRKGEKDSHITTLYSMRCLPFEGCYYKKSFKDKELTWLPSHLENIKEIYGKENIGLVTYKEVANIIKSFGLGDIEMEHFGYLRGKNTLENKKVLIVIGTYLTTDKDIKKYLKDVFYIDDIKMIDKKKIEKKVIKKLGETSIKTIIFKELENTKGEIREKKLLKLLLYFKLRREYQDEEDLSDIIIPLLIKLPEEEVWTEVKKMFGRETIRIKRLVGEEYIYPIQLIFNSLCDEEMYQAYHRNRGLRYPRIIFAYGWFPERLGDEFRIVAVPSNEEDEKRFWYELMQEGGISPTEIEKKKLINKLITKMETLMKKEVEKGKSMEDILKQERMGFTTKLAREFGMYDKEERDWIDDLIRNYFRVKHKMKINKEK